MTPIHLHLVLNHIPLIGTVIGLFLLLFAVIRKEDAVAKSALGVFVATGVIAAVVFLTGEGAEEAVEHLAGVSHAAIEAHEEASLIGLIMIGILGLASLGAILLARGKRLSSAPAIGILILALATSGVMGWVGNLGGQINHPEIRPAAAVDVSAPESYDEAVEQSDSDD